MDSSSVGAIGASTPVAYQVAVTQKQHSQQEIEGQQSVQLIQAAAAPLATSGDVGTRLHVVA